MLCNRLFTPLFFPPPPPLYSNQTAPYTLTKTDERTNTMHPSVYSYLLLFTPLYSKKNLLFTPIPPKLPQPNKRTNAPLTLCIRPFTPIYSFLLLFTPSKISS